MRIEIRNDSVILDGYVNAVARDSRPMLDDSGEKFVEQISPKAFQRAIEKSENIFCLLNHENSYEVAQTSDGTLTLFEDNIGLRAICKTNDKEVMAKAKGKKLRGWSFGFEAIKEHDEPTNNGFKRRFVDEMNLFEVSIIDERKLPCYVGTSIETRADNDVKIEYRGRTVSAFYPRENPTQTSRNITRSEAENIDELARNVAPHQVLDYSKYEKILKEIYHGT